MIKHKFKLTRRFWKVYVYYDVDFSNIEEIITLMENLSMPESYIKGAYTMLKQNLTNTAATYSNISTKTSIIVFVKTRTAREFVNSFVHEILHLANHIARSYQLNVDEEEICYIAGDAAKQMFKYCHKLMCNRCRESKSIS